MASRRAGTGKGMPEVSKNKLFNRVVALLTPHLGELSRLTGLPIFEVDRGANFHVFIVNEDERRALGPRGTAAEGA